jgi:tRNA-specific 2-thiouridylase
MKGKVAVGLSGGIDSSVAAYLLKKEGADVEGFTLNLYSENSRCCDLEGLEQAEKLCQQLDIKHHIIDVRDLFHKEIIEYFIKSYLAGLTPNPCVFCNRLIKIGYLFGEIRSLGFQYLATGHYASIKNDGQDLLLSKAKDSKKSQEYFLSLIPAQTLKHLIFPLANYTKDEVRKIVDQGKFAFQKRKESQDICFVKDKTYYEFIEEHISDNHKYSGHIKHVSGEILGKHKGIYHFTCGQRGGLGVAWKEPLYVKSIDSETKTVVVGERECVYKDEFSVSNINWFTSLKNHENIKVKIRYNSPLYDCFLKLEGEKARVSLKEKVGAVAAGQIAAFYSNDLLLGGGIIVD